MTDESTERVAKAIRAALKEYNAFVFSDRRAYDALAKAAIKALQLTEETRELADGMGGISTNMKTGEVTSHFRPCTRLRRLVGPWGAEPKSNESQTSPNFGFRTGETP